MNKARIIYLLLALQAFISAASLHLNNDSKVDTESDNVEIVMPIGDKENDSEIIIESEEEKEQSNRVEYNNEFISQNDVFTEPVLNVYYGYLKNNSLLFQNINDNLEYEKIDNYQKVVIFDAIGDYYFVQTQDLKYGYILISDVEVLPETFVEIDISDQTLNYYKDGDVILTSNVVTGKNTTPTYIGYFDIDFKTTATRLRGPILSNGQYAWDSYVDYWMPFDGSRGLHDAQWRSEFGGSIYEQYGSHGCVNMPLENAKTLYENVEVGTRVLVHK